MALQTRPPSRLDSLREALTRPSRISKPRPTSRATESHFPSSQVASHPEESEKAASDTGDDPADESQDDGMWEADSVGNYETSGPPADATKKWDDLDLPAICDLERRLRRLESLLDKQISWNNEIQKKLAELREEPPTAEPASKTTTRAKRPRTSGAA